MPAVLHLLGADLLEDSAHQDDRPQEEEQQHKRHTNPRRAFLLITVLTISKVHHALTMLSDEHEPVNDIPDRAEGTCEWIESHENYKRWVEEGYQRVLWVHGFPGCGKSVMAKYLAERLAAPERPLFRHSFSLESDKRSADKLSFATSLAAQVLKRAYGSESACFQETADKITIYFQQLDHRSQLNFPAFWRVICDALCSLQSCILIVDALDECEGFGQPVIELIDFLMTDASCRWQIVVISRTSDRMAMLLANCLVIAMDEKSVMPDIRHFVTDQINSHPDLKEIESAIIEKTNTICHGSFFWASTMIHSLLCPCEHQEERLDRLKKVPDKLSQFYKQLVYEVGKGKTDWELGRRRIIFLLLLSTKRTLTIQDVAVALGYRGSEWQPKGKRLDEVSDIIERLCWPLVTITNSCVILTHTLVGDFLTQTAPDHTNPKLSVRITRAESHAALAERCLQALSEKQNSDPDRISHWLYKNLYKERKHSAATLVKHSEDVVEPLLYEYAAKYWTDHLTEVKDPTLNLLCTASCFLHSREFVMYSEFLYNINSGEIGPIANVLAKLRAWQASLPTDLGDHLFLYGFFEYPYRDLAAYYSQNNGSSIPKYLCLFQMGNYYGLTAKTEPRYNILKEVSEGLEAILGEEDPLVLRAKYMFAACLLPRREFSRALDLAKMVSELQKVVCGLGKNDYWATLQLVALLQFLKTDFIAATSTQAEVSTGLQNIPNPKQFNLQMSEMFTGYIYEARGFLVDALKKYMLVEDTQRKAFGEMNALTISAQVSMAAICRKQGDLAKAREILKPALTNRQALFGEMSPAVVDTTIQYIIMEKEIGDEQSLTSAKARIDALLGNGSLVDDFERYCQVKHLDALILVDQGETSQACSILQHLLHEQNVKGREANNRSLLWVRLDLATLLRYCGKGDEAAVLFIDLVIATGGASQTSQDKFDCPSSPKELECAERALRLVRRRERSVAEYLLKENGLRWVRKEDFWLISGFPSVDTAWMKGP